MLEKYLIEHCAPTLASIKTASMFICPYESEENLMEQIRHWNEQLCIKGIALILLKKCNYSALIYVCRMSSLQADLKKPGTARFLKSCGYFSCEAEIAISDLKKRLLKSDGFPHEIGIFLGYPLGDVIGFIVNGGRNCKCCGCWKVYCNEAEAQKCFKKYKKCRDMYCRLWSKGRSVLQLTVAD